MTNLPLGTLWSVQFSKHLLISWLQSPSAVILEHKKLKSDTVSAVSPSTSHEVMGPDAMIFLNLTQMTIISTIVGRNPLEEME